MSAMGPGAGDFDRDAASLAQRALEQTAKGPLEEARREHWTAINELHKGGRGDQELGPIERLRIARDYLAPFEAEYLDLCMEAVRRGGRNTGPAHKVIAGILYQWSLAKADEGDAELLARAKEAVRRIEESESMSEHDLAVSAIEWLAGYMKRYPTRVESLLARLPQIVEGVEVHDGNAADP